MNLISVFSFCGFFLCPSVYAYSLEYSSAVQFDLDNLRYHEVEYGRELRLNSGKVFRFFVARVPPGDKLRLWKEEIDKPLSTYAGPLRDTTVWSLFEFSEEPSQISLEGGEPLPFGRAGKNFWGCLEENPLSKVVFHGGGPKQPSSELMLLVLGHGERHSHGGPPMVLEGLSVRIFDSDGVKLASLPLMEVNFGSLRELADGGFALRAATAKRLLWATERAQKLLLGSAVFTKLFFLDEDEPSILAWSKHLEARVLDSDPFPGKYPDKMFELSHESFHRLTKSSDGWKVIQPTKAEGHALLKEYNVSWASGFPTDNSMCKEEDARDAPLTNIRWVED